MRIEFKMTLKIATKKIQNQNKCALTNVKLKRKMNSELIRRSNEMKSNKKLIIDETFNCLN